jgi:hypothetical protein
MSMSKPKVFISYAGQDEFEADLLKFALETLLADVGVGVWIFQQDQNSSERNIAKSLKERVKASCAMIFLVSPTTLERGATQWMELAYADAFDVPTFVLLHRLQYDDLTSSDSGVPPLLLSGQCNAATDWRTVTEDIRTYITKGETDGD